jgi:hypothetical protein
LLYINKMSEYSPPNWTEPLSIYNPINFQQTAQSTNGGGGGGSGYLKYPVAQGSQTMKNTLINGSFQVQAGQAVSMGGNIVQSGGTPVNPTDLATKAYVDLNAGTQNLQSVLTAGNTTGNFNIEYADTYGCVFNGLSSEKWVLGVDPNSFTSTASNDLYVAGNAVDNYFRIGNATGGTFSEVMKVGIDGASAKAVAITGTLSATSITDSGGSKGTSGQVLTCGGGATLTWGAGGGGGAGTLDATLALGNTATGTYANISLTDTAVGGSANPILSLNNTEATTGAVVVDLYKNKTGATSDIVGALNFYGKDNAGTKVQYGGIESSITSAGGGGGVDGALDFYSCVNAGKSLVFRMNGADNENNSFRPLDMNGNNINCSSGSMSLTTATSTGAGTISLVSKTGATAAVQAGGSVQISALAGSVSTTATTGIVSSTTTGGIGLTSTSGNNTLTATAGSNVMTGLSLSLTASTNAVINTPLEYHSGVVSTSIGTQVYTSKYQPILSTTPNTLPVANFNQDGQEVMLINSKGDGNNELTGITTSNFTITCFEWIVSLNHFIACGYNNNQNRPEVRCATTIENIYDPTGTGSFTFIAFASGTNINNYIWTMCYDPVLFPTTIAIGGEFVATTTDIYNGAGGLTFPSLVSNFLCIDITTATIAPLSMNDPAQNPYTDIYGTNGAVYTIATYASANIMGSGNCFIIGGNFTALLSNGGTNLPVGYTAEYIPVGGFTPINLRWIELFVANGIVNTIATYNANVLVGGEFSAINVGGASGGNPHLAWCADLLTGSFAAVGGGASPPAPFTPATAVKSGSKTIDNTSAGTFLAYFGELGTSPSFPVYSVNMADLNVYPPVLYKDDFPTTALAFGANYNSSSTTRELGFIVGYDPLTSSNSYIWDFQTPQYLDLNGAANLYTTSYDNSIASPLPYFSVSPPTTIAKTQLKLYYFDEIGDGSVVINTTTALPFVSYQSPLNKHITLTLANRNNFAMGTLTGYGTDDVRIFFYIQNGATFSN